MDLVVGATGLLGGAIALQLSRAGRAVRALVRETSDSKNCEALEDAGVTLVRGDLKLPQSLRDALAGVDTLVTTATSTLQRSAGDSIDTVDNAGNLALISAAQDAGVRHVVFTSFQPQHTTSPLEQAKCAAEQALRATRMNVTVLRPSYFLDVWFSSAIGCDIRARQARLFGEGSNPLRWVLSTDVAKVAVAATMRPATGFRTFSFGGPLALSQREVIALFERQVQAAFKLDNVPEAALRDQVAGGRDPLGATFAALMLHCAAGDDCSDNESLRELLDYAPTPPTEYVKQAVDEVGAS
jgi:uncharacterized protein YbjT (DUF2867 family)